VAEAADEDAAADHDPGTDNSFRGDERRFCLLALAPGV